MCLHVLWQPALDLVHAPLHWRLVRKAGVGYRSTCRLTFQTGPKRTSSRCLVGAGAVDALQQRGQEARWQDDSAIQGALSGLSVALQIQRDHVE